MRFDYDRNVFVRPDIVPIFFRLLISPNELGDASMPVWFLLLVKIEVPPMADLTVLMMFCVAPRPKLAADFVFM